MLREGSRSRRRLAVGIGAAAICSLALAGPAYADFIVNDLTNAADPDINGTCDYDTVTAGEQCSLLAAIQEANDTPAHDTIIFSVSGTHFLDSTHNPTQPVTIDGNGPTNTVINGNDTVRLYDVQAATTFRDLTLRDGTVTVPVDGGGAAIMAAADLVLDNVVVTSNHILGTGSGRGAGILSDLPVGQTVTITDSTITDNTIGSGGTNSGAGIFSVDTLNLTDSTVSGNMITAGTAGSGGGITASTDLDIQRSTISGNTLASLGPGGVAGGGIHAVTNIGTKTITNSTISGNEAGDGANGDGGGANFNGPATITNSTFEDNNSILGGDDIQVTLATVTVQNTIFGSGTAACGGSVVSATPGHNIDAGTSCMLGGGNGNQENTDPLLGPLGVHPPGTGMTETHPLLPGSPAIDAGSLTGLATDQRGVPRPQGAGCDIGAYERDAANDAPSCAGFPVVTPPVVTPTPSTPTPAPKKKRCKKKKKGKGAATAKKCKKKKK